MEQIRTINQYKDPQKQEYVDRELPTRTVKLSGPAGRTRIMAPGGTIPGSLYFSGTYQATGPGTQSFRVTRISVSGGTNNMSWMMRHSREGTLFCHTWSPGVPYDPLNLLGRPGAPIVSFGPGTMIYGFLGTGGNAAIGSWRMTAQTIEGIPG